MKRHSKVCLGAGIVLAGVGLAGAARPAFAQCTPALTGRMGGDVPQVVSIDSNRILVANSRGLEIFNVANAAAPQRTGRLEVGEAIGKMRMFGGKAYVVTDNGTQQSLRVYSVSGLAPVLDSTFAAEEHLDFEFSGLVMYLAIHPDYLQCTVTSIDMSIVGFPLQMGNITLPAPSNWYSRVSLSVSGSKAFVGYTLDSASRLAAINISDPFSMSLLGNYDDSASPYFGPVVALGNYAYVAHYDRVEILGLFSFPSFPLAGLISNVGANDVAVAGSTLFVASSYAGVRPYNLANPIAPSPYTPANTPGSSVDITIVGDRLYNADREGGVTILQIGNPAAITQLGTIAGPVPSHVQAMVDVGTTLYVLDELGLKIFSTAAPDAPVLLGSLTLPDVAVYACSSRNLGVYNGNAYITGCDAHLRVVSVANPAAPFLRADLPSINTDYDMAFSGNYGYFCGQNGLTAVNITNPSAPVVASIYTLGGVTISVETQGAYLYLGTRDNGLWVMSLANPTALQLVGYSAAPFMGSCYGLQVSGNTAFVGRGGGLEITDISNPTNPVVVATMPGLRAGVQDPVIYRGGILHVQGYTEAGYTTRGIHRVDVSSLTQPVVIGSLLGDYGAFTAIGSRLYADDTGRGDMVISAMQTQWKPAFRRQPQDTVPCLGSYALFSVNVSAQPTNVTYRWQKDGVPLPLGGRFVGADQANLTVLNLVRSDAGAYECVATNTCGTTTSARATLSYCLVDINCDEAVDFFDYLDFVNSFSSGSANADFNADGVVDFFDYLDFVDAFVTGCG